MLPPKNCSPLGLGSRFELLCSGGLLVAASLVSACSSDAGADPDDGSAGKSAGGGGSSAGGAQGVAGGKNTGGGGSSAAGAGSAGQGNGGGAGHAGSGSGGASVGGSGGASVGGSGGASNGGASGSGGAGSGKATVEACLDSVTKLPTSPVVERLRFSGAGVDVGVLRYMGDGAGLAIDWRPLAFALVRGTQQACVTTGLKYTLSRHNFNDFLNAPAPAGATWSFNQQASEGFVNYKFTVQEKQGTTSVWGPLALKIEACRDLVGKKDCDYTK